jgi:hypothetical protein
MAQNPVDLSNITWGGPQPSPQGSSPAQTPAQAPAQAPATPNAPAPMDLSGITWGDKSNNTPAQQPQDDDKWLHVNDSDNLATKAFKEVNAVGAGFGEGLLSTVNGAADILGVPHDTLKQRQSELQRENSGNTIARGVGYGGETLVEFMLGDEALKALPMAEQLARISKTMKILDNSPRLVKALAAGARMGIAQGAQTTVRTGDSMQGLKDGAFTAALGAPAELGLGLASEYLGKAGKAAKTVEKMSGTAASAPSEQGVFTGAADAINKSKDAVDEIFNNGVEKAEKAKNDAVSQAEADSAAGKQTADDKLATRKDNAESMAQDRKEQDAGRFEERKTRIENAHQAAKRYSQTRLISGLQNLAGTEAVAAEDLAQPVNDAIDNYEANSHTHFEDAINDEENGIVPRLEGQTIPVADSPVAEGAGRLLNTPNPADHPAVAGAKKVSGDQLNSSVKQWLDDLSNGHVTSGTGQDVTHTQMPDFTAKSLVDLRQAVRKASVGFQRGDVNRRVLGGLIEHIDETIAQMSEHAGDPEVVTDYQGARATYKSERANLDTTVADKLRLNSPDKALDDVTKYLTGGSNPLAKLQTVRNMAGDGVMQELSRSKIGQWRTLAESDPAKFVKEFSAMSPEVRQAFFGDAANDLQQLVDTYTHTSEYADTYAKGLLKDARSETAASKVVTRQLVGNTGPGEKQLGGLIGEGIKKAHATEVADIASRYDSAVKAAQDAYDAAIDSAKGTHDTLSEPFSGSFMKQLSEGRVNEALLKGKVDVADITKLKAAVPQDAWSGIQDGIFQRAVVDASPGGRFNPEKLMNWWTGIKPEVRSELFDLSNPANLDKYQRSMDDVEQSAAVKRMVKYFALYPVAGTAGLALSGLAASLGAGFAGIAGGILAGSAGVATEARLLPKFVDWAANHPNTWSALAKGSGLVQSPAVKAASKVGTAAVASNGGKMLGGILSGVQNSLAGR